MKSLHTLHDSREVSRAFACRTCDGSGEVFGTSLPDQLGPMRCPECLERAAEARRLDQCQRSYQRAMLLCWLVPLLCVGLALAWVVWRALSGRWGL